MTSIVELPEAVEHDAELVPTRNLGNANEGSLPRRVSIGFSEASLLTPGTPGVAPDLAKWLNRDRSGVVHHVIHLSCNFRRADEPIVEALLAIELSAPSAEPPIVWSMDPLKLATTVTYRRAVSLTPTAMIIPELIGLEVGLERSAEFQTEEYYVVAAGEGEPSAEWFFRKTRAVELVGVHRLVVITRTAPTEPVIMQIALSAKVRRHFGGIIPYRAELPEDARRLAFGAKTPETDRTTPGAPDSADRADL